MYAADTKQLIDAGFHGVKLDDCGDGTGAGLLERVAAINASGRALLIENSAANAAFLSLPLCPPRHLHPPTNTHTTHTPDPRTRTLGPHAALRSLACSSSIAFTVSSTA